MRIVAEQTAAYRRSLVDAGIPLADVSQLVRDWHWLHWRFTLALDEADLDQFTDMAGGDPAWLTAGSTESSATSVGVSNVSKLRPNEA